MLVPWSYELLWFLLRVVLWFLLRVVLWFLLRQLWRVQWLLWWVLRVLWRLRVQLQLSRLLWLLGLLRFVLRFVLRLLPDGGAADHSDGTGQGRDRKAQARQAESLVPAKAKLIVELPADAKLYIDDQLMKTPSAVRQFNTPELQPGQTYYYMVRVEMPSEGTPQTVTRRVLVRAGEEVTADFKDMKAPLATVKK